MNKRSGIPIVISAASGTGKTSLCKRLLETLSHTARSISYTTRPVRGEEVHGRDYYFVDAAEFDRMTEAGEFIEWAEVFGNRYGTAVSAVQAQLDEGVDVLLDIDVQGGQQVNEKLQHALLVFLLPPSADELRRRLVNRAEDSPDVIAQRLKEARDEIRKSEMYEYLVINDEFDQAASDLRAIIKAHRSKRNRPSGLVDNLLGAL